MKRLFLATTLSLAILASSANAAIGFSLSNGWAIYFKVIGGVGILSGLMGGTPDPYQGGDTSGMNLLLGMLLLDGGNSGIQFTDIAKRDLLEIGLTDNEANAYLALNEEISLAFNESVSHLTEESTEEDFDALLDVHREVLGPDAISAGMKVLKYNANNIQ